MARAGRVVAKAADPGSVGLGVSHSCSGQSDLSITDLETTLRHGRSVVVPKIEWQSFGEGEREILRILPLMMDVYVGFT